MRLLRYPKIERAKIANSVKKGQTIMRLYLTPLRCAAQHT